MILKYGKHIRVGSLLCVSKSYIKIWKSQKHSSSSNFIDIVYRGE